MKPSISRLLAFALTAAHLVLGSTGCDPSSSSARPKLVVVIVVDQFRYDFLERFKDAFGTRGFKRLMNEGALFVNANYDYAQTYTAPGHASIFTGSVPAQNGIVGNNWYDRESDTQRVMVSDDSAKLVTSYGTQSYTKTTRPASPRILIGTTIGDQMRLATEFRSKVVAVALKDRAAVLPGGREANGAYWFDASSGTLVSSDYYFASLPGWVDKFNGERKADAYFGKVWDRALGPGYYELTQGVTTDVRGSPLGRHFPYTVTGGEEKPGEEFYKTFQYTPFASEYLADFAKAAIVGESLGSDKYPDLLAISFSTPDLVGHAYGPDSEEVEDTYVRLDGVIGDLLSYIDQHVGLSSTLVAVTGDHGVSPVPRLLSLNKIDASVIDPARCVEIVEKALSERFGSGKWVLALVNDQVYLDRKVISDAKSDPAEVERVAASALLTIPGIAACFTRTQIVNGQMPPGPISRRVSNGFNPKRSGDVWLITNPFNFLAEGELVTTHGSPYDYDTHVPIILSGGAIRPDRYYQDCAPADIAPTLCALLGIEPPSNRTGRVLAEALSTK
ncbi:MAG TPA: alkaline phosphatase family protein [Blastocatellia bacterium]|nr:alkaline phosphatase family protein [Blastocatellia bacterium]